MVLVALVALADPEFFDQDQGALPQTEAIRRHCPEADI
jgi:hypothetical protein